MNIQLFNKLFSDLVLYSVSESYINEKKDDTLSGRVRKLEKDSLEQLRQTRDTGDEDVGDIDPFDDFSISWH